MQWLTRVVPKLLVVAALAVVIVALVSDHDDDYGAVPLPPGGTVELPAGDVNVFVDEFAVSDEAAELSSPLAFTITPVGGNGALAIEPTSNEGSADQLTRRSEAIGASGAIARIEVPSAGGYRVSGGLDATDASVSLNFGTSAFAAVGERWKLWGGLLAAAFLLSLIRVPRRRPKAEATGAETGSGMGGFHPPRAKPYNG